jgi:hypothetical protein
MKSNITHKILPVLVIVALALIAANPMQQVEGTDTWREFIKALILLVVAAAGAPVTQAIKNLLKIEDRWALILTGAIAGLIAVLEMWLSGQLDFKAITLDNFPVAFFAVFSVATIYYGWLKNSPSFMGRGALLKELPKQ